MGHENEATFDSYLGIELELSSGPVLVPALRVTDGMRLLRLCKMAGEGSEWAAWEIAQSLPRALGLDPDGTCQRQWDTLRD